MQKDSIPQVKRDSNTKAETAAETDHWPTAEKKGIFARTARTSLHVH